MMSDKPKIYSKEWCQKMAALEGDDDVSAGIPPWARPITIEEAREILEAGNIRRFTYGYAKVREGYFTTTNINAFTLQELHAIAAVMGHQEKENEQR